MGPPAAAEPQWRFPVALGAAGLSCVVFAVLLTGSLAPETKKDVSAVGFVLGGAAILASGFLAARRCEGRRRRSWLLLSWAAAVAVAGNLWVAAFGEGAATEPDLVSAASIAIALCLSITGLLGLAPARQRGAEQSLMVLDGLVVGCAVLVIVSIVVYSRLKSPDVSTAAGATTLLFPLLDVVLATVALLLIVRSNADRLFFSLAGVGFLLYAVADLAYAVESAQGPFEFGTPQDLAWIAGYFLLAAAAWHPAAVAPSEDRSTSSTSDVQGTLLVFGILLGALAVQVLYPGDRSLTETQTVLWMFLVLAAGTRQTLLTADNAALRSGLEQRVREQTADLRRMARQTEILLSSVGDGIYGVDPEGRITFVNPSGARVLGHTPGELLGTRAHDKFHGPQPDGTPYDEAGCYVTEAISRGVVSTAEEDTYVRADGSTLPVEITSSPLLDEDRIRGAVVVFRDVTQRHEVDRLKNEFLSVVSHELRTPLTSIRGSLGLLATGALVELTPQAQRMVSIAVDGSDRLTRLINDILDIERVQSGQLPMDLVPHDALELVREAATGLSGLAEAAGIRLEVAPSGGRVLADADRIVQTLTNLVGNAIKFSHEHGVVRIEAVPGSSDVTFAVHDEGRGIPEDKLRSIFEPFVQVDSSDARLQGGTGLGLAISRGIVERHGGRIWAESSVEAGTTVRFSLPKLPDAVLGADEQPGAPVVLVCDEDPRLVGNLATILGRHGYRSVGVTTGQEAFDRAVRQRPAAVLVDGALPGTTGAEALRRLKGDVRTSEIPVVVISGPMGEDQVSHDDLEEHVLRRLEAALRGAVPVEAGGGARVPS